MSLSSYPFLWFYCILPAIAYGSGNSSDKNPTYAICTMNCQKKCSYIQYRFSEYGKCLWWLNKGRCWGNFVPQHEYSRKWCIHWRWNWLQKGFPSAGSYVEIRGVAQRRSCLGGMLLLWLKLTPTCCDSKIMTYGRRNSSVVSERNRENTHVVWNRHLMIVRAICVNELLTCIIIDSYRSAT